MRHLPSRGEISHLVISIHPEGQILLIKLRRELSAAIEKEDYEEAARLRDEIFNLSGETPATTSTEGDDLTSSEE